MRVLSNAAADNLINFHRLIRNQSSFLGGAGLGRNGELVEGAGELEQHDIQKMWGSKFAGQAQKGP
eukprot:8840875-Pyramimonas_sp.AAC.1